MRRDARAGVQSELFENMLQPQELWSWIAATEFATTINPLEGFIYPGNSRRLQMSRHRNIFVYTA